MGTKILDTDDKAFSSDNSVSGKIALDVSEVAKTLISTNNSTSTPLADAAVFTGTGEDVSKYSVITIITDTDVDGTLSVQFSTDNTNWDRNRSISIDTTISSGTTHIFKVVSQYFRLIFTNSTGNGAQSYLRIQAIFHLNSPGFLTVSPDQIISNSNDVQLVRNSNDIYLDISRGLYGDLKSEHVFGFNSTIPNGSFADVWAYGPTDATYNWPSAAENFRVKAGGNANDTAAGSGARTIQIVYLDSTGVEIQEQLTLAGTSASGQTASTGRRLIKAFVDTAGTILSSNTGNIIIENASSGQIVAFIAAGVGQTELSQYTVPLGFTAYLKTVDVSVSTGSAKSDADVRMWRRTNAYTVAAPFGVKRLVRQWSGAQSARININYKSPIVFDALTDIWFEAKGNGAVTAIGVDYEIILLKNDTPLSPQ